MDSPVRNRDEPRPTRGSRQETVTNPSVCKSYVPVRLANWVLRNSASACFLKSFEISTAIDSTVCLQAVPSFSVLRRCYISHKPSTMAYQSTTSATSRKPLSSHLVRYVWSEICFKALIVKRCACTQNFVFVRSIFFNRLIEELKLIAPMFCLQTKNMDDVNTIITVVGACQFFSYLEVWQWTELPYTGRPMFSSREFFSCSWKKQPSIFSLGESQVVFNLSKAVALSLDAEHVLMCIEGGDILLVIISGTTCVLCVVHWQGAGCRFHQRKKYGGHSTMLALASQAVPSKICQKSFRVMVLSVRI